MVMTDYERQGRRIGERPLDRVETQAVRAYQRALVAHRDSERSVKRATTELSKRQAQLAAQSARKILDTMLAEMDEALLGDGA